MKRNKFNTKTHYTKYLKKVELEELQVEGQAFYTFSKKNYIYIGNGNCYCTETKQEALLTMIFEDIRQVFRSGSLVAKRKAKHSDIMTVEFVKKKKCKSKRKI